LLNRLALFLIELLWLTDKKPGSTGRGHAARDTAFGRQSIRVKADYVSGPQRRVR
jgi:hypothetical protein